MTVTFKPFLLINHEEKWITEGELIEVFKNGVAMVKHEVTTPMYIHNLKIKEL